MTARTATVRMLKTLGVNKLAARAYYRYVHGFASAGHELPEVVGRALEAAVEHGVAKNGEYYEFGLFKGHTFLCAQQAADRLGLKGMRFFGFDSFRGLPEPEGLDRTEREDFYRGQYACSYPRVRRTLTEHGMDWGRAALIPGFFEQTLTDSTKGEHLMRPAAVVLIDCDLYESATQVMAFVQDLLVDGSIVIMDDWKAFGDDPGRGAQRAWSEFLETNPGWRGEPWFEYGSYGRVFIMRRENGAGKQASDAGRRKQRNKNEPAERGGSLPGRVPASSAASPGRR